MIRSPRILLWLTPAILVQTTRVRGQDQPEIVTHDAPATFSSRVNLVSVPVEERDRDGRARSGRRSRSDFQIFDTRCAFR